MSPLESLPHLVFYVGSGCQTRPGLLTYRLRSATETITQGDDLDSWSDRCLTRRSVGSVRCVNVSETVSYVGRLAGCRRRT